MPISDADLASVEADIANIWAEKVPRVLELSSIPSVILPGRSVAISKFISADGIPDLSKIPPTPERLRHFAFNYATALKSHKIWGREYGVVSQTITDWLSHPGVKAIIAICRYEQNSYAMAQYITLQQRVYKGISNVLEHKITGDTIGPIVSMLKFLYQILHFPESNPGPSSERSLINVNIGSDSTPRIANPYHMERNITPKQIAELESQLEELRLVGNALGVSPDTDLGVPEDVE